MQHNRKKQRWIVVRNRKSKYKEIEILKKKLTKEIALITNKITRIERKVFHSKEEIKLDIKNIKFKLIFYKTTNEWNLFDLVNDPKEEHNLTGNNLPIESELKEKLLNWINR